MTKASKYAFYGSLRRGMRLYDQYKLSLKYLNSVWLQGFDLYSLGNYPYAIRSENQKNKILVEIFEITNKETEQEIINIEIEAGYVIEEILIDGEVIKIFLFENSTNDRKVDSGDWVTFFRY
jgi:gamma-glutamylcyclotransferase (GGCT)/AIG2-like uncharacterized protein YtfP